MVGFSTRSEMWLKTLEMYHRVTEGYYFLPFFFFCFLLFCVQKNNSRIIELTCISQLFLLVNRGGEGGEESNAEGVSEVRLLKRRGSALRRSVTCAGESLL